MYLKDFRIENYRSISDSGLIEASQRTALVGRNESGKTNILHALQSLNPPGGVEELTYAKDFPRHLHPDEFVDTPPVVWATWVLSEMERQELAEIFPRAEGVTEVIVWRRYNGARWVVLKELPDLLASYDELQQRVAKMQQSLNAGLRGKDEQTAAAMKKGLEILGEIASIAPDDADDWAEKVGGSLQSLQQELDEVRFELSDIAAAHLDFVQEYITSMHSDEAAQAAARDWVLRSLPVFVYVADYAQLEGHQNLNEFNIHATAGQLGEAEEDFAKLMKVAGLDAAELQRLLHENHEERQQMVNRAGAVVTIKLRELWKDRELTVRFNVDDTHFLTLVSDGAAQYPVEVNLDERSNGFKWFFSFYITFTADTEGGPAENAVLLLDEPGIHLHGLGQRDLLGHFRDDFANQIIYTTHSPFMIAIDDLASVRTVNVGEDGATEVSNTLVGDGLTLFPLQTALGYDVTQALFAGSDNLVVEDVTDFWYLSSMSSYLKSAGGSGLPDELVITPAGGAQKVSYMAALLASEQLQVLVLLDSEEQVGDSAADDLIRSKLISEGNVVFVNEVYGPADGVDIEDLLEVEVFEHLVEDAYASELEGHTLNLNNKIARIVKRYEDAFREQLGIEFEKSRPARLFMQRMAEDADALLTGDTVERFEGLFEVIAGRLEE